MLPEINTILELFERMTLDEKVYFSFNNEEDIQICIMFTKKPDKRNWSIWLALNEQASKQTVTINHLRQVLKAFKISEKVFIKEIADVLLLQTAYADEFIRQITEVLGKEAVQKSILQTQNFMDELASKIKNLIHENEMQDQEKIKATKEKAKNKQKFKIIK
ncbi:hypothetical protein GCL60_11130 [Silvanigrella paludirubra]|uniref:Uncharacterized protein n=1 Tax=Silvanigrella paludirubra TaxID=2499159 RepID=A0A6N6VRT6_9BACT|nr:hypothetical protein [Silvanigrella paludirubra]KAB8037718.1 hypothetical protein GCL60_11130 [Silvanigrella paludirubra]